MAIQHRNLKRGALIPAPDYLILRPVYMSNTTEKGIFTGAEEQALPFTELIACGENCPTYEVGAYLMLSPMGGYTYTLMGVDYVIARESDVVCQVESIQDEPEKTEEPTVEPQP